MNYFCVKIDIKKCTVHKLDNAKRFQCILEQNFFELIFYNFKFNKKLYVEKSKLETHCERFPTFQETLIALIEMEKFSLLNLL